MSPETLKRNESHLRFTSFESCFINTRNLLPFSLSQCTLRVQVGSSFLKINSRSTKSLLFPILSFRFLTCFFSSPRRRLLSHLNPLRFSFLMISYLKSDSVLTSLRSKGECSSASKSKHKVSQVNRVTVSSRTETHSFEN